MNKNFPKLIVKHIAKEFFKSLFIVFLVFLSLSVLTNFVEEMSYFKEKKINNLILFIMYVSIIKTPNTLIEVSIFIFLFTGIIFFSKIQKNREINTILLSGLSKFVLLITPATLSFAIGLFIIFIISPISSSLIKIYENSKRVYSSNDNLIVINSSGLWFMENDPEGFKIIRADTISGSDFTKLNNVTIYVLDKKFNFTKRMDSKIVRIKNKNWNLENTKILINDDQLTNKNKTYSKIDLISSIEINDLKDYFINSSAVSFWEISQNISKLNQRGYSAEELKVKFHKYLSLPIYLFGMILLATIFTISSNKEYNTFMYLFFGLIVGFFLFFLNDLSIAVGLSNKLPLFVAVWSPALIVVLLSMFNLIKINEK